MSARAAPLRHSFGTFALVLALGSTSACTVEIAAGLTESQARDIVIALDEAGIPAASSDSQGGYRVVTDRTDVPASLRVLARRQLPRESMPGFDELLEETRLIPSPHDERARYHVAVAGELSESLRTWPGVSRARVHLALASGSARFGGTPANPDIGASVLLWTTNDSGPTDAEVTAVCEGAVAGLKADSIRVVRVEESEQVRRPLPLAKVGPIWVAQRSLNQLKAIGGFSLAVHGILSGVLIATVMRARRRRRDAG